MDKSQLSRLAAELNEKYINNLSQVRIVSHKRANFSKTRDGKIGDILKQRHSQRSKLFWFSIIFVIITTLFVFSLIGTQAYLNYIDKKVTLIDSTTLQIIVTGIFVQFVGLVGIITKSIWNDKPYLDAGVINERKKNL